MLKCRKKKSRPKEKEVKQSSGSSCCVKVISVLTKSYLITIQKNILLDRWLLYFWDKNTWRAVFLRKPIRSWATNPHQSNKNINEWCWCFWTSETWGFHGNQESVLTYVREESALYKISFIGAYSRFWPTRIIMYSTYLDMNFLD